MNQYCVCDVDDGKESPEENPEEAADHEDYTQLAIVSRSHNPALQLLHNLHVQDNAGDHRNQEVD